MATYALTLSHDRNWDGATGIREQANWVEHAAFMDQLVDEGFLILGGPLGDGDRTLHCVQAADERRIRKRMAQDPWARSQLLRIESIEPWALWLDSRRPGGAGDRPPLR